MDENKKKKEKIDKKGKASTFSTQVSKLSKEAIAPPVRYYTEDKSALTVEQIKELKKIWEDYGYPSLDKLLLILKEKDITLPSKKVKEWINKQRTYQIHKGKKVKKAGSITTVAPNTEWNADLLFYRKDKGRNKKQEYILLCVDIFTRKMYGASMSSKSPKSAVKAFLEIFEEAKAVPKVITTDSGTEFKGETIALFEEYNIIHRMVNVGDHRALGILDKASQTIRSMIAKQFTQKGNRNWVDYFKTAMRNYNNTPHNGIYLYTPNEAEKNASLIYYIDNTTKNVGNNKKTQHQVGDKVRVRIYKGRTFSKGFDPTFSSEIYTIQKIVGKSALIDDGTNILHHLYDLLVVEIPDEYDEPEVVKQESPKKQMKQVKKDIQQLDTLIQRSSRRIERRKRRETRGEIEVGDKVKIPAVVFGRGWAREEYGDQYKDKILEGTVKEKKGKTQWIVSFEEGGDFPMPTSQLKKYIQ